MLGPWVHGKGVKGQRGELTTGTSEKEPDVCVLNRMLAVWNQVCMCLSVRQLGGGGRALFGKKVWKCVESCEKPQVEVRKYAEAQRLD